MLNVGNKRKMEKDMERSSIASLSLYNDPPMQEISLDQFESYAIDRLRVLKSIEGYRAKNNHMGNYTTKLSKLCNMYLPLRLSTSNEPSRAKEDARKDQLSHFILRMAFCQSEELRRWFLTHESLLFRFRLDQLTREEKMNFMKKHGMTFELATKEDIGRRLKKLKGVRDSFLSEMSEKNKPLGIYFKVPFYEALELVGSRKVYLEGGMAFVPMEHLVAILFARFRSNMSRQLAIAYKNFPRAPVSRDDRLIPVLKNVAKHHAGPDFTSTVNTASHAISPEMIEELSKVSMPLCMRSLHGALRKDHHLKHGGRMQYGLFLKGIGLELEDALSFWRKEFCKKINVDDFNKRYSYNIRHNYGKEGKRKDYTPFNCGRIITGEAPKNGDFHGCPYRHSDPSYLKTTLLKGIDENSKDNIMALVKSHQYQLGCKRYFEATHKGGNSDVVGNHPNIYFDESRKYFDAQNDPHMLEE